MLNAFPRELVRLVRKDGEGQAAGGEVVDEFGNADVRAGVDVPTAVVGGAKGGDAAVDVLRRARSAGQRGHKQSAKAAAEKLTVSGERMRGKSALGERRVRGLGDIAERVEQCAVEVEEDGAYRVDR